MGPAEKKISRLAHRDAMRPKISQPRMSAERQSPIDRIIIEMAQITRSLARNRRMLVSQNRRDKIMSVSTQARISGLEKVHAVWVSVELKVFFFW